MRGRGPKSRQVCVLTRELARVGSQLSFVGSLPLSHLISLYSSPLLLCPYPYPTRRHSPITLPSLPADSVLRCLVLIITIFDSRTTWAPPFYPSICLLLWATRTPTLPRSHTWPLLVRHLNWQFKVLSYRFPSLWPVLSTSTGMQRLSYMVTLSLSNNCSACLPKRLCTFLFPPKGSDIFIVSSTLTIPPFYVGYEVVSFSFDIWWWTLLTQVFRYLIQSCFLGQE